MHDPKPDNVRFDQELDCNQPLEKKANFWYEGFTFTETEKPYRDVVV
jgi:hypothetical protein